MPPFTRAIFDAELSLRIRELFKSAPDYETLLELNRDALRDRQSRILSVSLGRETPTSIQQALGLSDYGLAVLTSQPQLSDQLLQVIPSKQNLGTTTWRRVTQKAAFTFLIPTAHGEFPTHRLRRLFNRLLHHHELTVAIQRLSVEVPIGSDFATTRYTHGISDTEDYFFADSETAEEAMRKVSAGPWNVHIVEFPIQFDVLPIGGEEAVFEALDANPVLVYVTTREWTMWPKNEAGLLGLLEHILVDEGFKPVFSEELSRSG